jgi:transcription-repair coupling factor (superfamily II helicase)
LNLLKQWQAFQELAKRFAEGEACLRVAGVTGAARALVVAELVQQHPRPALVVVATLADAHRWTQDLRFFGATALEFPETEPRLWRGGHHREADAERAVIARRLGAGEPIVVVATPAALDTPLPRPADFAGGTLRLAVGDSLDRELLVEAFERGGYERVETVVEVGQWTARGGIVDIFSPMHGTPARLEFFGDDIESIRLFDPTTQRSTTPLDELLVLPLTAPPETSEAGARLLEYIPRTAPVILDAPALLDETSDDAPGRKPLPEMIEGRPRVELVQVTGVEGRHAPGEIVLDAHAVVSSGGHFAQLTESIARWRAEGFLIRLVTADSRQAEHLRQMLRDHQL